MRALSFLALVVIGGAAHAADLKPVTMNADAQKNEGLEIATATRGALSQQVTALAYVAAESSRVLRITPAGTGKVLRINVLPGQTVRAGDD